MILVSKNLVFYLSNILQVVFRFAQMIVVTRTLSSMDLGIYYGVTAYPQLFSRFFDLGLTHAARYFILMVPADRLFIIRLVFLFSLGVFAPIYVVFFLLGRFPLDTSEIISAVSENYLILSVYCLLLLVNAVLNSILLSLERFKTILWTAIVPYTVFIVIVLYKATYSTLDVKDVVIQLFISELLLFTIYLIGLSDIFKDKTKTRSVRIKQIFSYSIRIYPNSFLKPITTRLDRIILSLIATPTFIGYYSVLMTLREVSILPVTTYGQVLMNKLSGLIKKEKKEVHKLMNRSLIIIFLLYSAGFGCYLLVKDFVLYLFFKEVTIEMYQASYFIFLSIIPLALFSLLTNFFLVTNKPSFISWSILVSILVFYAVVFFGFKILEGYSFTLAVLFSTTVSFIFLVIAKRKKSRSAGGM